jgi:hypothetical protein
MAPIGMTHRRFGLKSNVPERQFPVTPGLKVEFDVDEEEED